MKPSYLFCAAICLILCAFGVGTFGALQGYAFSATAEVSTPHVVVTENVWLLTESGEKLFLLPATYYVRINNLDENYYYVTFNGVSGKVPRNTVSAVGYHAVAQGTLAELQISPDYAEFTAINLKVSPDASAANATEVPLGKSMTFLGEFPTESGVWYYVKYDSFFGYIKRERTTLTNLNIPAFVPEELPAEEASAEPAEEEKSGNILDSLGGNELKILIIVGLAVPAVAVILLLFRPKKEKYYEDG